MADISRSEVATLIQDAYSDTFHEVSAGTSVVLSTFPTVNMGTKTTNLPVLATTPHAKWVGESATDASGVKPTAQATWANKQLVAEELAVIIPIHENVVDDATTDTLGDIATLGAKAISYLLDATVLFGLNKPASWVSPALVPAAVAAGQVAQVSATPGADDLGGAFLQAAGILADAGHDPSDAFARSGLRYQLANLRDSDGRTIFMPSLSGQPGSVDLFAGLNMRWVKGTVEGAGGAEVPVWDADAATGIVVDREKVRIGVRQDITVKFLDQATVGGINLAERDMIALRFKARYAYVLGDHRNSDGQSKAPVSIVTPADAG